MADRYLRSTDGSDADNGTTWALAKAKLAGIDAIDTAGDRIFVSQVHDEDNTASQTWSLAGTEASPTKILCGNDAAEPPTALATTGIIKTTGNFGMDIRGACYIYGLTFRIAIGGAGSAGLVFNSAGFKQVCEECKFQLESGNSAGVISLSTGFSSTALNEWKNCQVKFDHAGQRVTTNRPFEWRGGGLAAGTTSPTFLLTVGAAGAGGGVLLEGLDLSAGGASMDIFSMVVGKAVIRNCKLPASWTGDLINAAVSAGCRAEMYNCDSGDTNYRLWIEDFAGNIKHETTIVRTGGASDGTTTLSWKMASSANAEYPHQTLVSPEIVRWNETTGSAITVTVEIIHDSQGAGASSAFQDDEIWLEVQYLGTSGFPLGSFIDDAKADVLATAADQTSSSETWTTTGLTTPVKQKLAVTFTPNEKGFIHAKVHLAKASKTAYVDPELTVS